MVCPMLCQREARVWRLMVLGAWVVGLGFGGVIWTAFRPQMVAVWVVLLPEFSWRRYWNRR